MVLLDISATGEENLIEQDSGNQMNDLEYRRKQLLKLQEAVIDLEDLSTGVSIADLTLTDFRIDLAEWLRAHPGETEAAPLGVCAAVRSPGPDVPPGAVFCLQAEESVAARAAAEGYPLAPFYLVHVDDDGGVLLSHLQAKQILDRLKRSCFGRLERDPAAVEALDRATQRGSDMRAAQKQLAAAVAAIVGRAEEKAVASLFRPGGTQGVKGEFSGTNDFEVVGYVVILPAEDRP